MGCRSLLSATALVASLGLAGMPVVAQQSPSNDRVLAQRLMDSIQRLCKQ